MTSALFHFAVHPVSTRRPHIPLQNSLDQKNIGGQHAVEAVAHSSLNRSSVAFDKPTDDAGEAQTIRRCIPLLHHP